MRGSFRLTSSKENTCPVLNPTTAGLWLGFSLPTPGPPAIQLLVARSNGDAPQQCSLGLVMVLRDSQPFMAHLLPPISFLALCFQHRTLAFYQNSFILPSGSACSGFMHCTSPRRQDPVSWVSLLSQPVWPISLPATPIASGSDLSCQMTCRSQTP